MDVPGHGHSRRAGVVLLLVFVLIERKAAQPIMPLRLFASRRRTGAYVARFLYLGAMIGFFFFTTQSCTKPSASTRCRPASGSPR